MKRIQNTVALAEQWSKATGVPVAEVRLRVRALRFAGLLPDCRSDRRTLTAEHIAAFIIGATASETHLNAAQIVKKYAKLRPLPGSRIGNQIALENSRAPLVDALASVLRRARVGVPQFAVTFTASASGTEASLVISQGDDVAALLYGLPANDDDGAGPWPPKKDVTLAGPVLGRMAALLEAA